jgi:hypothetical protein
MATVLATATALRDCMNCGDSQRRIGQPCTRAIERDGSVRPRLDNGWRVGDSKYLRHRTLGDAAAHAWEHGWTEDEIGTPAFMTWLASNRLGVYRAR